MIRVARPALEPASLTDARAVALAKLGAAGPASRDDLPDTYKVAHADLWSAQHMKCAYCEKREQSKRNDVEHFRPAMRADRAPGSEATHGYWWLAYTWENLLFACRNCNQSPAKLDQFPLDIASVPLAPQEQPPGLEKPLLIDPAGEPGVPDIEFVEESRPNNTSRWVPRARNGSVRGDKTIRVCMLDRPDLVTLYTHHVHETLEPDRKRMRDALATEDAPTVRGAWQNFLDRHLGVSAEFVGLARDVLVKDVPDGAMQRYGLKLPEHCIAQRSPATITPQA